MSLASVDHYQAPPPPALRDLPEEVTLDGKTVRGTEARVYHLLRIAKERELRLPVGRHRAPAGWVPRHLLVEPWSGGAAGDRRLRDLRERGVQVERDWFSPDGERASNTSIWRLVTAGTSAGSAPPKKPAPKTRHTDLQGRTISITSEQGRCEFHASLQLDPGLLHGLAPAEDLADLPASQAHEIYLEDLRHKFATGELLPVVRRILPHKSAVWTKASDWAVEALSTVLAGLGATVEDCR